MSVLYKSAFELAKEIKSGQLRASDMLTFFLQRIAQLNPQVNAEVALDPERARSRAEAAGLATAGGEDWGPLHGVPFTIKDAFCTQGPVTTGGIPERRDYVPAANAVAVQRYINAGAQLASRYLGDRTSLAVARLLEQHHRGFMPPSGFGQESS